MEGAGRPSTCALLLKPDDLLKGKTDRKDQCLITLLSGNNSED